MEIISKFFTIKTKKSGEYYDITQQIADFVKESDIFQGLLVAHSLHTTTGLVVNEGSDPGVGMDVSEILWNLVPESRDWHHTEESPLDSAAHVKAQLIGNSILIGIDRGRLVLGKWQRLYFIEYIEARERRIFALILGNRKSAT